MMSEGIRFLHTLAQALSSLLLYSPGHPATRRSIDTAWDALMALVRVDEHPIYFFIGTAPVYDGRALHELREWPFARRLAEAGIQRLEFDRSVTVESLEEFFQRIMVRLSTGSIPFEESQTPIAGIMFGSVAVEEVEGDDAGAREAAAAARFHVQIDLSDEVEAIGYVLEEGGRGAVARAEAEAVTRILGALLNQYEDPQIPFTDDFARYSRVHPINTALLSMAAARAAGVDPTGRHRIGVAAIFHDIGMTRLPSGIGTQPTLTAEDRAVVETHTREGARLLLDRGGRGLELAATVAFEHQLRPDGGGYPRRRFRPVPHWASRLIGAASAYVALRAPRPYRPAWSPERALGAIESGAGAGYDAEAARLLVGLLRQG